MANIKELKKRIKSTKSTLKITTAMKLVSAAKLAKAQAKIQGFRPYVEELDSTVRVCAALNSEYDHKYLKENEESQRVALLVISSDKGLCGGYNSHLFKKVRSFVTEEEKDVDLYFIGNKVKGLILRDQKYSEVETFTFERLEPTFNEVKAIASKMAKMFSEKKVAKVYLAYNKFESAISFVPTVKQALPMTMAEEEKRELEAQFPVDFLYEPNAGEILDNLVPEVLNSSFYAAVLDAIASEHGSRMSAMDSASTNCKDMIRSLTLKTNKLRQAAITTELVEVVSGAESLNA